MSRALPLLLILVLLGLNGCGKKPRNVDPPDGATDNVYPKRYPPPDQPGTHL